MDTTQKAALTQVLHRWMTERNQTLLEQVMLAWEQALRDQPSAEPLQAEIETLIEPSPTRLPVDTDHDLGTGLDLVAGATSQGEALKRLLDGVQAFAERSAIFVVKQGIATLYATRGFDGDQPRLGAPVLPPPELEALLNGQAPLLNQPGPAASALLVPLSRLDPAALRVFPLRLRRKVVALLYADSGTRQAFDHPHHVRALAHAAEAALAALAAPREEEKPQAAQEAPPHAMLTQRIPEPIAAPAPAALDPKLRANAERSARVLVGDIELYSPQKIQSGLAAGNLYAPLREELERSRASFIDRYGAEVEQEHAIFANTVTQLLCQGDPRLLAGAPWAPRS